MTATFLPESPQCFWWWFVFNVNDNIPFVEETNENIILFCIFNITTPDTYLAYFVTFFNMMGK